MNKLTNKLTDTSDKRPMGIYIHWPYCLSKCPYCDFNSHIGTEIDDKRWINAFIKALGHYAHILKNRQVVSIFFGGGTPSLMPVNLVEEILDEIHRLAGYLPDEITLEANPTSVERDKFKSFSNAGITRVSLGVQALNTHDLKFLGREHSVKDALKALEIAKENFTRTSFDLIYARPGQIKQDWEVELKRALEFCPDHMSLYQLTIEPQTPFYIRYKRGEFDIPTQEEAALLYETTEDITSQNGLLSYEVSNYAKKEQECRHNLVYWLGQDYIGIGPGAHGRFYNEDMQHWTGTRHHRSPDIWLDKTSEHGNGAETCEVVSSQERDQEIVMMGLRLKDGIDLNHLDNPGKTVRLSALETLEKEGYLIKDQSNIRLTPSGRLVLDAVLDYILPAIPAEEFAA